MARKQTLADDLEDDFALDNDYISDSGNNEQGDTDIKKTSKASSAAAKRKAQTNEEEDVVVGKKGSKKSKNGSGTSSNGFSVPKDAEEQAQLWNKYMKKAYAGISELELQDISMQAKHIYKADQQEPQWGSANFLEELAKTAVSTGKSKNKVMHGAPQVLVICSSALRVIDLVKKLRPVSKRAVLKLFSRHIKISEQQKTLKSTAVDIAVGTPNRILKLLTEGSLKVNRLRLVVVDCWQDDKMRVVVDMDDTRQDLFGIWRDVLLPASANADYGFKLRLAM
ncbi:hypothetical protein GGI04_000196 [Coemansia thaxteri]|uniref:Protein CMS1 n=1 Tax=Coemansia thaxteri TaxID=2663907 RepID=A0A9W8BIT7_9FUNG|nr:hypothetical protein H4R26_000355 [Coemansia thaxteri]KAJ2009706.1 hypothetical protein GGI04_000196 [Coemansia thaxteri]KAJ2474227.1 hypothetical protein GGI02_000272 [Coemansia sp. RSA 2322]